ncbi:hypothetical protein BH11BAC7_BH11BAC7_33140 [soil metagenome]
MKSIKKWLSFSRLRPFFMKNSADFQYNIVNSACFWAFFRPFASYFRYFNIFNQAVFRPLKPLNTATILGFSRMKEWLMSYPHTVMDD